MSRCGRFIGQDRGGLEKILSQRSSEEGRLPLPSPSAFVIGALETGCSVSFAMARFRVFGARLVRLGNSMSWPRRFGFAETRPGILRHKFRVLCANIDIRRTRQRPRDDALRRHARLGRSASLYRHNILYCKRFHLRDAGRPGAAFPREAWERGRFKKGSGTVAGAAGHRPKVGRVLCITVPDPFLDPGNIEKGD